MSRNEAAERLNRWAPSQRDPEDYLLWLQTKQEALAAERRATVERIRERAETQTGAMGVEWRFFYRILDEEAAR